jgi:hypothetical protein
VAASPAGADSCALARLRVEALERALSQRAALESSGLEGVGQLCQQVLMTHGQGEFARCMAARAATMSPSTSLQQLEEARHELRRAQAAGCI